MRAKDNHKYFYYTVLVFIGLMYFPRLTDYGLFMDGSIYGAVSHNMALGDGSFWSPVFHNPYALQGVKPPIFYEHPPLMYWMESWFFRLFGDGFWVEGLYGTVILVLHILVLTFFYRMLTARKFSIYAAWPVILLWYSVPSISWSFPENMLDNSLSLWALLSVMVVFVSVRRDHFLWAVLGGILMGLAVLVKGPLGFFPLASIGLYWLASLWTQAKGFRYPFFRALYKTVAFAFGFAIVGVNLYILPEAREFMSRYLYQQVIPSVLGQREMDNSWSSHLSILQDVVVEYAPVYMFALFLWVVFRLRKKRRDTGLPLISLSEKNRGRFSLWLFLVWLSATLPIALSAKSHSFYLISGVPYLALSVGVFWAKDLDEWVLNWSLSKFKQRVWASVLVLVVLGVGFQVWSHWGEYKRDKALFMDLELLAQKRPARHHVGFLPEVKEWPTLHSNLERYLLIQTHPDWTKQKIVIARVATDSIYLDSLAQKKYEPLSGDWQAFRVFVRH